MEITIAQVGCPEWHEERKNRITSSLFGEVVAAVDRPTPQKINSLVERISGEKTLLEQVPSQFLEQCLAWGLEHEDSALNCYIQQTKFQVKKTGLWIFPDYEFLGASPDGIVENSEHKALGLVEIKCPYSIRECTISEKRPPYLLLPDLHLSHNHKYYHQVQGQLYATNLPWVDFVVWTNKDMHVQRVPFNPQWARDTIPKLVRFYQNHIRPRVCAPFCFLFDYIRTNSS